MNGKFASSEHKFPRHANCSQPAKHRLSRNGPGRQKPGRATLLGGFVSHVNPVSSCLMSHVFMFAHRHISCEAVLGSNMELVAAPQLPAPVVLDAPAGQRAAWLVEREWSFKHVCCGVGSKILKRACEANSYIELLAFSPRWKLHTNQATPPRMLRWDSYIYRAEVPRLPQFDRDAASTRAHSGANNQITAGPSLWGPAAERANRASALSNVPRCRRQGNRTSGGGSSALNAMMAAASPRR